MTTPFLTHFRQHGMRRFCAWMVLLAFLIKAMVPVGYMPDMNALQKGKFQITICTAYGVQQMVGGNADAQKIPAGHEKAKSEFCPFGWTPHAAVLNFVPELLPAVFTTVIIALPRPQIVLKNIIYSPAQPRAPPVL